MKNIEGCLTLPAVHTQPSSAHYVTLVTMRFWYIIRVLGNGPVDTLCVILEMLLVLQPMRQTLQE